MPPNFFILAYPRTGSYALSSMLNSANDIVCHGEIFKEGVIEVQRWCKPKLSGITPEERDAAPVQYLNKLRRLSPNKIFGFKAFPDHLGRTKTIGPLLNSPKWKKVVLHRDPIEVYASLLRARRTNVWVLRNDAPEDEHKLNDPVEFDEASWTKFLAAYRDFIIRGKQAVNAIQISYPEINDERKLNEVLSFLGSTAAAESLQASVKKQTTLGSVEEGYANWAQFSDYLASNPITL